MNNDSARAKSDACARGGSLNARARLPLLACGHGDLRALCLRRQAQRQLLAASDPVNTVAGKAT